jgi:phosphopantothenoylcysteine decarboxylase/phosphopantothenate--cysteine ligase
MAAAVADFVVKELTPGKIKKQESLILELTKAPDILQEIKRLRHRGQIVVGFAAEEGHLLGEEARRKLHAKGLDLIVANDISRSDTGFETETNEVLVLNRHGEEKKIPLARKEEIARAIWDEIVHFNTRCGDRQNF